MRQIELGQDFQFDQELSRAKVIANILIAANGTTTLGSASGPLRTPEDAVRFHQIRKIAHAILIGGSTFRNEPYTNCPIPVMVSSKTLTPISNDKLSIANLDPNSMLRSALEKYQGPILVEGGVNFLTPLLDSKAIELLFISRSPVLGDGNQFPQRLLEQNYSLVDKKNIGATIFEVWKSKI